MITLSGYIMNFRKQCFLTLHTPYTKKSKWFNGILSFLIIVSVALVPVALFGIFGVTEQADWVIQFEQITVTIFTIEYILRIYSAPKPMKYVLSWWGIIDLVAILPYYLAIFFPIQHAEMFSMLRILRILKLAKIHEMDHAKMIKDCEAKGHGHFAPIQGEKVERVIQKHPVIFMVAVIVPLVMTSLGLITFLFFPGAIGLAIAVLFFGFALIFYAKAWLDFLYDVIYITDQRIVIQNRKLFGIISNDISYTSITNVIPDNRGLIQWMLGFGDVEVQTAAGVTPRFYGAPKPHNVVNKIISNRQRIIGEMKESNHNNSESLSKL